ncbi:hypothetical protein NPIL_620331 [Nephila pilipes]|uniref:Uncharacterized protein n=1 Tax=Nephila pilipes TaxID=299642 RepID=A0A8X6MPT8_NEPPI|nr:hypothetical protein NPIL_620331 [Nephila pilipes]
MVAVYILEIEKTFAFRWKTVLKSTWILQFKNQGLQFGNQIMSLEMFTVKGNLNALAVHMQPIGNKICCDILLVIQKSDLLFVHFVVKHSD